MHAYPSDEHDGFHLDSGEDLHAEFPDTFWIPDRADREALQPGALVKLVFRIPLLDDDGEVVVRGERMWVELTERGGLRFKGVLDNDPTCTDDLRSGYELWFGPEHVIDIWSSE